MDGMDALTATLVARTWPPPPVSAFGVGEETLASLVGSLDEGATVVDVGCAGWLLPLMAAGLSRADIRHIGADLFGEPPGRPADARFIPIDEDGASFVHGVGDLVVSSHCLEHSARPIHAFGALLQACRPGGLVYVECPSELSALKIASDDPRDHAFESFWDDPTHVRPYSPGAFYRLAIGYGAAPLACGRLSRGGIPCSAIVCRRGGDVPYRYVSLKDVPEGVEAAMAAVWP